MNQTDNMTLGATLDSRNQTSTADIRQKFEWPGRICILVALLVSPWLYGSIYFSAQFLMAICCLVGIGFLWFESGVSERRSLILPYLLVPLFFGIVLTLVQIIPLGESADWLLGRQKELYPMLTGSAATSPSISMSTSDTWDQLGLLAIAFAALCLGCRYFRSTSHIKLFLTVVTVSGVAISLFGLMQALTTKEPNRIFWTVELLGGGQPFGPYVNRNNAAGYLLICLGASLGLLTILMTRPQRGPKPLGTKDLPFWTQFNSHVLRFVADLDATKLAAVMCPIVISVGLIGSLSRGGVLAWLIGAGVTLLAYGLIRRPTFSAFIFIPACGVAILIAFWLGMGDQLMHRMERIETVEVLSQTDQRLQHWKDTWPATREFGLLGSGVGAYDEVHRIYNSGHTQVVFRYAENQYYQAIVELGWPGLTLLTISWLLMLYYSLFLLAKGASASTIGIGVASLFVTVSVSVASFFDYGLYMPANMLLMSLFCGFVAYHAQSLSSRLKKKNWLRLETPNGIAQLLLLVTFAAIAMFALDFYRKWQIQSVVRGEHPVRSFSYDSPTLPEVDSLIEQLRPMVEHTRSGEGVDYMARLLIHRSRLQLLESLSRDDQASEPKQRWQRTSLDMMHENAWALQQDGQIFSAAEFLREDFIMENLPWAKQYLLESRKIDPMESQTHLLLGQVNAINGKTAAASKDMERAIMLAPNKTDLKYLAGFYYLQTGNSAMATRHFRDLLETSPRQFRKVMQIIFGGANRNVSAISEIAVARDVVPDRPELLYSLAKRHLSASSPARELALRRALGLLQEVSASDRDNLLIKAEVLFELQQYADAIEQFESCLDSKPHDSQTQFRVAQIHAMLSDLETAESKLNDILRMGDSEQLKKRSRNLLKQIEKKREQQKANSPNG
ncbi:O-antigen ligase family protein [Mariniblastus fucicola]|uniref:O-Antigen ligase n=1 Tax=Mariniblastus fucicola TaxID=980251 RepID=A0A5B9PAI5_9BACT|nr:O-antigen ligase family protein [Mariniblastus fucicola]QEG23787.1 O-Antigen ligase [Mariniblastus fucicola]